MKEVNITDLVDFVIRDNYIELPDKNVYLFRYYPPNTNILAEMELLNKVVQLQRTFDTISCDIDMFCTDKVENLNENKAFYESLDKQYFHLTSDIIHSIESADVSSTSVQKAWYFIISTKNSSKDQSIAQTVYNTLTGMSFHVELTDKKELGLLIRNYFTREFLNTDIFLLENEISKEFEEKFKKQHNSKKKDQKRASYFRSELTRRLCPLRIDIYPKYIEQGDILRQTIMIKNIPSSKELCRLRELAQIKNITFNMRLRLMNEHEMRQLVNNQMNNKKVGLTKSKATEAMDAERDRDDIKQFYKGVSKEKNKIYYTNIYIEMYGKSKEELKDTRNNVESTLRGLSFTYEPLVHYQKEGFISVSPFGSDMFPNNANNIPSNTLASLYPCSYSSRTDKEGMLLGKTKDGGNMFVDFFQRDLNITNGNYSITGQSGQGKSWLQKKIFSQQVFRGTTCFVFDPENEYLDVTNNLGGTRINCASGKVKINPFEVRRLRTSIDDTNGDFATPESFKQAEIFYQHLSWLKDFFRVLYPEIKNKELEALMILAQDVYINKGIDENTNFDLLKETDYPIFTDLYKYVEYFATNDIENRYIMIPHEIISNLLLILRDSYAGALGFLLNGFTNIKNQNMICFALNELLTGDRNRTEAVMFNIMTYCWNRIALREENILLCLDEFEQLISSMIGNYVKDFTKRARKYDAIIGTATQNISPLMHGDIKSICTGIYSNTAFKFIFHPGDVDFEPTKELLQLSDGEAEIIRTPMQKQCLVKAGAEKYIMNVGTLPYEEYLFGQGGGK